VTANQGKSAKAAAQYNAMRTENNLLHTRKANNEVKNAKIVLGNCIVAGFSGNAFPTAKQYALIRMYCNGPSTC
jgi:hypothetical protein